MVLNEFSSGDFHQVNMRDIAKKAGVGYASIFRHFKKKELLLFWFVDKWLSELIVRLTDHLLGLEDIKEKIRKIIWLQLDFYNRNPKVGRIIMITVPLNIWMQDKTYRQTRLTEVMLKVLTEGREKGKLDPQLPTTLMLDVIFGMIRRTFTMWIYRGQKGDLTDQAGQIFEVCWKAIGDPDKDK
ncbi:MAG: TetR/AcrR family transcriptional regulator [Deltaproteobacteria bacterium]|nr:TetR/AcrR family transcriptional regulator [Deltaproteobacteria bacterium]